MIFLKKGTIKIELIPFFKEETKFFIKLLNINFVTI